jgi:hypothetical protein
LPFPCGSFLLVYITFFIQFFKQISNLRPNMTYSMIKIQFFLHQTLDYNQNYFTLDHDYKFRIIIVLKDVWVTKSKSVYVFLFFECFEHMDPFLWNILKFTKKLKWFGGHLIRKKDFWNKKTTYSHVFPKCFKHIKRLLKHGEFSWNFCSCNFESIKIHFNN